MLVPRPHPQPWCIDAPCHVITLTHQNYSNCPLPILKFASQSDWCATRLPAPTNFWLDALASTIAPKSTSVFQYFVLHPLEYHCSLFSLIEHCYLRVVQHRRATHFIKSKPLPSLCPQPRGFHTGWKVSEQLLRGIAHTSG